jgi:hypothetical protein
MFASRSMRAHAMNNTEKVARMYGRFDPNGAAGRAG